MAQQVTLSMDGTLLNWLKKVGDAVKQGEIIAEVEADKATMEIEASADGVLTEQKAQAGDELREGTVIAVIGAAGEAAASAPATAPASAPAAAQAVPATVPAAAPSPAPTAEGNGNLPGGVKASPLARNIAREKGVDLAQVPGSGPGGRITKSDVEGFTPAAVQATTVSAPSGLGTSAPAATLPEYALPTGDDVELIEVSRMRARIAATTQRSMQQAPHFYVATEADVAALMNLRKELNQSLEADGVKISVNDLLVKALALALVKFPNLNTHFYGDKLARHKRVNIGISVALPNNGLINVVCHDADKRSLSDIAVENKAMIQRAYDGKIKPDDIRGSTFTISNLGIYDHVDFFTGVISPPEAGILAVGSTRKIPVVLADGTIGIGQRMRMTLSVDHRVSDGAEGAQFMKVLRDIVENPLRLTV